MSNDFICFIKSALVKEDLGCLRLVDVFNSIWLGPNNTPQQTINATFPGTLPSTKAVEPDITFAWSFWREDPGA